MKTDIAKKKEEVVQNAGAECLDLVPAVDILENETDFRMYLDMPGVSSDSLKVDVEEGIMKIAGLSELKQGGRPVRYSRSYQLSDEIDAAAIKATVRDGVLELALPKAETAKVHRIEVKAS